MSNKPLTLSIIIPAYNEERHLPECLDSIAKQTMKPDEVIVVDNNSIDKTREVANKYDFVRIVEESEQGLIPARNTGFDIAKGDILGRINADVVLAPGWVEQIKHTFSDVNVAATSGPAVTYLLPGFHLIKSTLWSRMYLTGSKAFFRTNILWGANMALRTNTWRAIRVDTETEDHHVHEDQDMSLLIASKGERVVIDRGLLVTTREQSYVYWPKLREYVLRRWRTKRIHRQKGSYANIKKINLLWSAIVVAILVLPTALFVMYSLLSYPAIVIARKVKN